MLSGTADAYWLGADTLTLNNINHLTLVEDDFLVHLSESPKSPGRVQAC